MAHQAGQEELPNATSGCRQYIHEGEPGGRRLCNCVRAHLEHLYRGASQGQLHDPERDTNEAAREVKQLGLRAAGQR